MIASITNGCVRLFFKNPHLDEVWQNMSSVKQNGLLYMSEHKNAIVDCKFMCSFLMLFFKDRGTIQYITQDLDVPYQLEGSSKLAYEWGMSEVGQKSHTILTLNGIHTNILMEAYKLNKHDIHFASRYYWQFVVEFGVKSWPIHALIIEYVRQR